MPVYGSTGALTALRAGPAARAVPKAPRPPQGSPGGRACGACGVCGACGAGARLPQARARLAAASVPPRLRGVATAPRLAPQRRSAGAFRFSGRPASRHARGSAPAACGQGLRVGAPRVGRR